MVNKKADKDKERQQEAMLPAAGKNSSNIENSNKLSNNNNNNKDNNNNKTNKGQNTKPNSNNNSGNNKKNAGKGNQQQSQRSGKKAKPQRQQIFLQSLPRDSSNYRSNSFRNSIDINSNSSNMSSNSNMSSKSSSNMSSNSSNISDTLATLDSGVGKMNPAELLTAALAVPCAKCSKPSMISGLTTAVTVSTAPASASTSSASASSFSSSSTSSGSETASNHSDLHYPEPVVYSAKQYRKSKSYMGVSQYNSSQNGQQAGRGPNTAGGGNGNHVAYRRSHSDRRNSFDRSFAERNRDFVPIVPPPRPVLSSSNIAGVMASTTKLTIIERLGKGRLAYPIMQVSFPIPSDFAICTATSELLRDTRRSRTVVSSAAQQQNGRLPDRRWIPLGRRHRDSAAVTQFWVIDRLDLGPRIAGERGHWGDAAAGRAIVRAGEQAARRHGREGGHPWARQLSHTGGDAQGSGQPGAPQAGGGGERRRRRGVS
ncbi:myb-like protein A isoform X4 [Drosophila simulans]|uniref:myb-like protein A isoform X4 n=1 Tax=Drosophila simulans TaxID=7240 RepID=UPI00192CED54|nr:myb-like protein A isoform X4 [Drosophila simulans]